MDSKNKRYRYFQMICKDLNSNEKDIARIISDMRVLSSVIIHGKTLKLLSVCNTIHGELYTIQLSCDGKILCNSPVYIEKPKKHQRTRYGVHSIIAVSLLIGFTLAFSSVIFFIVSDYTSTASNHAECIVSATLYDTGVNSSYFVVSVTNLGSNTMTGVNVTFVDDNGIQYGFEEDNLDVGSGEVWRMMDSFMVHVSDGDYMIRSSVIIWDGSIVECSAAVRSQ